MHSNIIICISQCSAKDGRIVARLYWSLLFLTFVGTMLYISLPSLTFLHQEPPMRVSMELQPMSGLQFPTLTVCAVQQADRWNVARMMLNQVAFECKNSLTCHRDDIMLHWEEFLMELIKHRWIAKTQIKELGKSPIQAAKINRLANMVLTSGGDDFKIILLINCSV